MTAKNIVLIHGAYAGPWSFDDYRRFFEDRGWTVHTPTLRYHDQPETDPRLAETSVQDYVADIAEFARQFDTPPVLGGHAIGALVAQQCVDWLDEKLG